MTTYALVKRLNELKIPRMCAADAEVKRATKRKQYDGWSRSTVIDLLRSTLYRGLWQYSKTKTQRKDTPGKIERTVTRKAADDDTVLTVAAPAIISPDLWYAAQEQLDKNKRKFMHPPVNDYILRGRGASWSRQ